jgi:hypothetical protein
VEVRQGAGDALHQATNVFLGEQALAVHAAVERVALQVAHDDVVQPALLPRAEALDDVVVFELHEEPPLLLEAMERILACGIGRVEHLAAHDGRVRGVRCGEVGALPALEAPVEDEAAADDQALEARPVLDTRFAWCHGSPFPDSCRRPVRPFTPSWPEAARCSRPARPSQRAVMRPLRAHLTVKPPGREAAVADRRSVCLAVATDRRPSPARFRADRRDQRCSLVIWRQSGQRASH